MPNDPWGRPNLRLVSVLLGLAMCAAGLLIGPTGNQWSPGKVDAAGWAVVSAGAVVVLVATFYPHRNRRKGNGEKR